MLLIRLVSRSGLLLTAINAIAVAIAVFPRELPAQHVTAARAGIIRQERGIVPCGVEASAAFSDASCRSGQHETTDRFRPVGMVVGAFLGATWGGLSYVAASEGGDTLLSFSNSRFPKAVAVGAAVGLLFDAARYFGSGGPSGAHE